MNTRSPMPTPNCAIYSPLLPLLAHGLLEETGAADVRAHLATCEYCQAQAALDDELDGALRRRFLPAGEAENLPFSTQQIMQMLDRQPDREPATRWTRGATAPRFPRKLRFALVSAAAAILLACLIAVGLFSRSGGLGGGPNPGQGVQTLPTVGSSVEDLNQFGARIDSDLDQITADQQAAATDNSQQDQVQP
jgi:outer membrane murein-binding lipoprotein Lpp